MSDATMTALVKKVTDATKALTFDRESTNDLLRHYQIYRPGAFDWPLVSSALFVARLQQATYENDFMLMCCLVADAHHQTDQMKWLCAFDEALSIGKFARVWPLLDELAGLKFPSLTELYTGNKAKIDSIVRRHVLFALAMPFNAIDKESLLVLTGVKKVEELNEVGKGVIEKVGDKEVSFVKNDANHPPTPQGPRALVTADVALLAKTIGVSM